MRVRLVRLNATRRLQMAKSSTDRIEKERLLKAPQSRVWHAISDAREFGNWFGVEFDGGFVPGQRMRGRITMPEYAHIPFEITVERVHAESHFSFRWHPHAIDTNVDYSSEPTTLVTFDLSEVPEGTLLRITESGFDQIPESRRAGAFRGNEQGWESQMKNIARYVGDPT